MEKTAEICRKFETIFRNCNFSRSEKKELGKALAVQLKKTRPEYVYGPEFVGYSNRPRIVYDIRQVNPQCESFRLRDIMKWQYRLTTGLRYSMRNEGAARGFLTFVKLWQDVCVKLKKANMEGYKSRQMACFGQEEIQMIKDLNELLRMVDSGIHNRDTAKRFCRKLLERSVLRNIEKFSTHLIS
jgi:hypothetical protein